MERAYTVVFVRDEDGRLCVHVPAIKGCHTWGETLPEAIEMAKEAMQCHLEALEICGDPIPEDLPLTLPAGMAIGADYIVRPVAL